MDKIAKNIKEEWNGLTKKFTSDYVLNRMTIDEYVLGKGDNTSFCYVVERTLGPLGGILGATSKKFGLYYGKEGKDSTKKYRYKKTFGKNKDEAFKTVKIELSKLISESIKMSSFIDIDSKFTGMFKYKIIYLYNPKIMIPVFYIEDLKYFATELKLKPKNTYEELQRQLLDYKKKYHKNISNHDFACILYDTYGKLVSKEVIKKNDDEDRELNNKIEVLKKAPKYFPEITDRKKIKNAKGKTGIYPRDPKMAEIALYRSKNKCENDSCHYCFPRRKDGTPYTEVHHLVPLSFYKEFEPDLDKPENIVSLCSGCHNEIHYGKNADKIIKNLYKQRKNALKNVGIHISEDELIRKYHEIFNRK